MPSMEDPQFETLDVTLLQLGMYIELDLGWMAHPFPSGSFKVTSNKQIEVIRGLGLKHVRYFPAKSDRTPEINLSKPTPDNKSATA
jgi:hypothetical protein